jgi:AraC family transcriptional regulator
MLTNSLPMSGTLSRPFNNGAQARSLCSADEWPRFRAGRHSPVDPNPADRGLGCPQGTVSPPVVDISPSDAVQRRIVTCQGMSAEFVQVTSEARLAHHFRAPVHLLVVYEQGTRRSGESFVEGLPQSTLRNFGRRFTFVPAGREYREWQEPHALSRLMFVYFDSAKLPIDCHLGATEIAPRLFFEDATLMGTALKLRASVESAASDDHQYFAALCVVLIHELARLNRGMPRLEPEVRGGLTPRQQRIVTGYMQEHLGEQVSLATLAHLVGLSPHHFCRAFKQSFGLPPRRYHNSRRMEHAKTLLAKPTFSVTDIGLALGFSETSSFTAAFRRATGITPSGYHRNFG